LINSSVFVVRAQVHVSRLFTEISSIFLCSFSDSALSCQSLGQESEVLLLRGRSCPSSSFLSFFIFFFFNLENSNYVTNLFLSNRLLIIGRIGGSSCNLPLVASFVHPPRRQSSEIRIIANISVAMKFDKNECIK
jgi:hypothetical protein